MTLKQSVDLRNPDPMQFGNSAAREQYEQERKAGLQYPIEPTLPAARQALEEAKAELRVAESNYGAIEEAVGSAEPASGDLRSMTPWEVTGGGGGPVQRRLRSSAAAGLSRLRGARERVTAAAAVSEEVKARHDAALESQTVRYAVAPNQRISTSGSSYLQQGEEVPPGQFDDESLQRLIESRLRLGEDRRGRAVSGRRGVHRETPAGPVEEPPGCPPFCFATPVLSQILHLEFC